MISKATQPGERAGALLRDWRDCKRRSVLSFQHMAREKRHLSTFRCEEAAVRSRLQPCPMLSHLDQPPRQAEKDLIEVQVILDSPSSSENFLNVRSRVIPGGMIVEGAERLAAARLRVTNRVNIADSANALT